MVHRPYNAGRVEFRFLFITSPALDGFFAEMADLSAAPGRRLGALTARARSQDRRAELPL
ncbi:hypothetical protein ACFWJM_18855 [Streptomyces sp. NPDC127077]|uniref:hypothetical protein n=1 Tax=Streptomyces sp. NPDC127077 TaxID=3347131 RepID=UPI00364FE3D6